jgi:hypothetical protein
MSNPQTKLAEIYQSWKASLPSQGFDLSSFSPPLLLSVPHDYRTEGNNLIVFGQETFGWSWTKQLRQEYPNYKEDYEFKDLESLSDFSHNEDSIEALTWGYEQFDFASKQPRTATAPFWAAFRDLKTWGFDNVLWSNLAKCDFQGGSILQLDQESQKRFFQSQTALISGELESLAPKAIVFFTGPNYDRFLEATFPGISLERKSDSIVQLKHALLPPKTFRTYHPAYLRRSGNWDVLSQLRSLTK